MKENQIKAFDFAADTTKQLISISTAIIALMVTFSKDIIGGNSIETSKSLLAWTWGIFIISIILGIMTLMALTGTLQPKKKVQKEGEEAAAEDEEKEENQEIKIDINNGNIRLLSGLQILFFVIAISLTARFGYVSLNNHSPKDEKKSGHKVILKSTLNNDSTTIYYDTLYLEK